MTLIDGDRIVTAHLYDDEHEEFTEKKMSIIDCVNAYTVEGVTTADDVLDNIIADIENTEINGYIRDVECYNAGINFALHIIAKHKSESEDNNHDDNN